MPEPAPEHRFDVFISHSSEDKMVADALCAILEQQLLRCWIAPRDILPGKEWGEAIIEGIEQSRAMVVVFSSSSNNSTYVLREIERAVSGGLIVVPVRIEDVLPSNKLKLYLSATHWLDAITEPVETHFVGLAEKLKTLLGFTSPVVKSVGTDSPPPQKPAPSVAPRLPPQPLPKFLTWVFGLLLCAFGLYAILRDGASKPQLKSSPAPSPLSKPDVIERLTTVGNSLKMMFVPVTETPEGKVLGCIHETRSKDFAAFIADKNRGYEMTGDSADDWRTYEYKNLPVGRGKDEKAEDSCHPVCCVCYEDAQAFCQWLTTKERREGLIGPKDTYRLPTDSEWSLMVGIGDKEDSKATPESKDCKLPGVYPWGSWPSTTKPPPKGAGNYADETAEAAGTMLLYYLEGYTDGYATTAPVMSFEKNSKGFFDLGGNAYEWCEDWYDIEKTYRLLRGASWYYCDDASDLLSSRRHSFFRSDARGYDFGFRCVLMVVSGG